MGIILKIRNLFGEESKEEELWGRRHKPRSENCLTKTK